MIDVCNWRIDSSWVQAVIPEVGSSRMHVTDQAADASKLEPLGVDVVSEIILNDLIFKVVLKQWQRILSRDAFRRKSQKDCGAVAGDIASLSIVSVHNR